MATFFNQASLSFGGSVTNSNVTVGEVLDTLAVTKSVISSGYSPNGGTVYAVSLVNSGTATISGITVSDDLGEYTEGELTLVPFDYVDGTAKLYIDGTLVTPPTVSAGPPLVFSGISLPAGASALLLYEVETNENAPLASGSTITNTVTVTAEAPCVEGPITASATVTADDFTALSIAKSVCPEVVSGCDEVTYTFVIQNSGNVEVVATDNLIVSDTFSPALSDITVTLDGNILTEGVDYTYDSETGFFTTLPGAISVPAASFVRDPETGVITTTPGVAVLTLSGTI